MKAVRNGVVKSEPLTRAERQRRWRAKQGHKVVNVTCCIQSAAALLYIKKQWGIEHDTEAVKIALRYLAVQTRMHPGMKELKLDID